MKHINRLFMVLVIMTTLLAACAPTAVAEDEIKPVRLEPIAGSDLNRVILTEKAAERLGLETVPVIAQQVEGAEQLVIPYAALLYDSSGAAWVYVNVEPLVFVREPITVDFIDGNKVILSEGLDASTIVVTLGATELFGSEEEFEEE